MGGILKGIELIESMTPEVQLYKSRLDKIIQDKVKKRNELISQGYNYDDAFMTAEKEYSKAYHNLTSSMPDAHREYVNQENARLWAGNKWERDPLSGRSAVDEEDEHESNEDSGMSSQDIANAIFNRIERTNPQVFTRYGVEAVVAAVHKEADFHEGSDELGTSDIGVMVKHIIERLEDKQHLEELSPNALANYKKKAGQDASKADAAGDFKRGNKRFRGIVKATKKQFKQDLENHYNNRLKETEENDDDLCDSVLEHLTGGFLTMRKHREAYGVDGWERITRIYNTLRSCLKDNNFASFEDAYNELLGKYPDATTELIDSMFEDAGLGDHGTYDQFMGKVKGLSESENTIKCFIITAKLAEGGTKKFRVKAQSMNVAKEKFNKHHSMAKILDVKEENVDESLAKELANFDRQAHLSKLYNITVLKKPDNSEFVEISEKKSKPGIQTITVLKPSEEGPRRFHHFYHRNAPNDAVVKLFLEKGFTEKSNLKELDKLMNGELDEGRFTKNIYTGKKLHPRTGEELPDSPEDTNKKLAKLYAQTVAAKNKFKKENMLTLNQVWSKIEQVVGNIVPDGDPIDWLAPWLEQRGYKGFEIGELLDKACKKHGYKDLYDYYDDVKKQVSSYDDEEVYETIYGKSQSAQGQRYYKPRKVPNQNELNNESLGNNYPGTYEQTHGKGKPTKKQHITSLTSEGKK